jgi:hypothetical protein
MTLSRRPPAEVAMLHVRSLALPLGCFTAALAAFTGCGAAPGAKPAPPIASASDAPRAAAPAFDECKDSGPVPRVYDGILRGARCDQQRFLTMASVADQLGVVCVYCHVPLPSDPKKEDYPVMTPRKEIANWMSQHLMQAIKPADGSPMRCKSCHTDENGKPVTKILGNPRDPAKAAEWMAMVMVNRFVAADGSKLRCRSCHVGTMGTPEWQAKVILRSEQIPKHVASGPAAF